MGHPVDYCYRRLVDDRGQPALSGICGARDGKRLQSFPIRVGPSLAFLTNRVWALPCGINSKA
jgi:hypothetical protein